MTGDIRQTACRFAWDYHIVNLERRLFTNCCRVNLNPVTAQQLKLGPALFDTHPDVVKVKQALLSGIKTQSCDTCWQIEHRGGVSPRSGFEDFVQFVHQSGFYDDDDADAVRTRLLQLDQAGISDLAENLRRPRMVEINIGSTCDLKCMYCGPRNSTQWAAELDKHDELPSWLKENTDDHPDRAEYEQVWWSWLEQQGIGWLRNINFLGGEPLIIDRFYDYTLRIRDIYAAADRSDTLIITVVTNLNTPERYLKKFMALIDQILDSKNINIELMVSCESMGARANFIRTGTDWSRLTANLDRLLAHISQHPKSSRIYMTMLPTINCLCVSDLHNFFRWFVSVRERWPKKITLGRNQIVYPAWLDPAILPPHYTSYIDESKSMLLAAATDNSSDDAWLWDQGSTGRNSYISWLDGISRSIANPEKSVPARQQFAAQITKLCQRRDLDFQDTFPEMVDFYELCKAS